MEKELQDTLEDLGLSEKEIKVYVSLVETGESSVNLIAKRSELNRVTVYPILKGLIEKGFVSKFLMDRRSFFNAIDPKQIIEILREKERRVKAILPLLESRKGNIKNLTSIELFKGKKGISSFIEKIYSSGEPELWAYGNGSIIGKTLEYQSLNARNIRLQRKIKLNIISSPAKEEYFKDPRYKSLTKIKFNDSLENIQIYILFGRRTIGILELSKELFGIIIENEEIAHYHKFVFDLLLKTSK